MQCKNCKGDFNPPANIVITSCPFCQAPLKEEQPNLDPNSNEAKILKIVEDNGVEIYTKKSFIALIMDYFPNDKFGRLLTTVIEKKGADYIYKLKDYPVNEIQINYLKILEKLADETFIPKEVLAPAVELLCFGLGIDVQSVIQQPAPAPAVVQPSKPASPLSDFKIINGRLIKYIGKGGDVVIPNSVTSIGRSAFWDCNSLTQVTIPNSVTKIRRSTFADCTSLTKVTIPNSVTSIGDNAFNRCTSLRQVTIPNSVTSIGIAVFSGCESLTQVTIPNLVTEIRHSAFCGCKSLTQVTIPNSVTSIYMNAFWGCNNLPQDVVRQIKRINTKAFG